MAGVQYSKQNFTSAEGQLERAEPLSQPTRLRCYESTQATRVRMEGGSPKGRTYCAAHAGLANSWAVMHPGLRARYELMLETMHKKAVSPRRGDKQESDEC